MFFKAEHGLEEGEGWIGVHKFVPLEASVVCYVKELELIDGCFGGNGVSEGLDTVMTAAAVVVAGAVAI